MREFTSIELEAAQKAILSQIHKNEKAKETLLQKQTPRTSQVKMVDRNLKVLYLMSSLIASEQRKDISNSYSKEDLEDAVRNTRLLVEKVEKIKPKFKEGTPQHTLAIRRIEAFNIALVLIERELGK